MFQQRVRACVAASTLVVFTALPAQVLAERVKVYPTQGDPKIGELVERVPGSHIILQDDAGVRYRIEASLVRSVEPVKATQAPTPLAAPAASTVAQPQSVVRSAPDVPARPVQPAAAAVIPARAAGSASARDAAEPAVPHTSGRDSQSASTARADDEPSRGTRKRSARFSRGDDTSVVEAPALPPLTEATRAALVSGLLAERIHWESQYTGIATPTLLIVLGIGAIAGGIGLTVVEENHHGCPYSGGSGVTSTSDWSRCNVHPYSTLGAATAAVGGLSLLTGIGLLAHRTSDGRQSAELQRIDDQLRTLGVQASVAPWITGLGTANGPTAGLQGHVTF